MVNSHEYIILMMFLPKHSTLTFLTGDSVRASGAPFRPFGRRARRRDLSGVGSHPAGTHRGGPKAHRSNEFIKSSFKCWVPRLRSLNNGRCVLYGSGR